MLKRLADVAYVGFETTLHKELPSKIADVKYIFF